MLDIVAQTTGLTPGELTQVGTLINTIISLILFIAHKRNKNRIEAKIKCY